MGNQLSHVSVDRPLTMNTLGQNRRRCETEERAAMLEPALPEEGVFYKIRALNSYFDHDTFNHF